jgi:hypothetical protein
MKVRRHLKPLKRSISSQANVWAEKSWPNPHNIRVARCAIAPANKLHVSKNKKTASESSVREN